MGSRIRQKKNVCRGMHRRLKSGKKPMSTEQKEAQKKASEIMRERTKKDVEKKKAKK